MLLNYSWEQLEIGRSYKKYFLIIGNFLLKFLTVEKYIFHDLETQCHKSIFRNFGLKQILNWCPNWKERKPKKYNYVRYIFTKLLFWQKNRPQSTCLALGRSDFLLRISSLKTTTYACNQCTLLVLWLVGCSILHKRAIYYLYIKKKIIIIKTS